MPHPFCATIASSSLMTGDDWRVLCEPTIISLCLARVRATFILRWSSNNWPTCMEGRGGEGRAGEGRERERKRGEGRGGEGRGGVKWSVDEQMNRLSLTCLSGLLRTKETMMQDLSRPWYLSTVCTSTCGGVVRRPHPPIMACMQYT